MVELIVLLDASIWLPGAREFKLGVGRAHVHGLRPTGDTPSLQPPPFRLNEMLTRIGRADPQDMINAKKVLKDLGYYETPDYGMTEYPDTPPFDGVTQLQTGLRLRPDGVMKPDGPTDRRPTPSAGA